MEIDKILFEELITVQNSENSFDNLSVNREEDNSKTSSITGNAIKEFLELSSIDDEPEIAIDTPTTIFAKVAGSESLKTGSANSSNNTSTSHSNSGVLTALTSNNIDTTLSQDTGVSYVIVGNIPECGPCRKFEPLFEEAAALLGDSTNCYTVQYNQYTEIYEQMCKEAGLKIGSTGGFPTIFKCVNGKAVEVVEKPTHWYIDVYKNQLSAEDVADLLTEHATETKNTTKSNPKEVNKLTSENIEENLTNTEGTSFVYLTNTGCGYCKNVLPYLSEACTNINGNANFQSVTYSENQELFWDLLQEAGYDETKAPIPMLIKYVDGKPVEIMSRADLLENKENLTEYLSDKIDKPYVYKETDNTDDTSTDDITSQDNAEPETSEDEAMLSLNDDIISYEEYIQNKHAKNTICDLIEKATSISELQYIITQNVTTFDTNVCANLLQTINAFATIDITNAEENSDAEDILNIAKESLLGLL